eukprot:TRINITY_DN12941_c0_g1_i1.p1 TRINITY_DN12941_c0_g1~~TRINITY_DN12941_c0_g1_i1.p1  ORF type:complete len:282 (-),score=45.76 TRINITY_DN12941_c0_g1_i1:273-1118(-)
MEEYFVAETGKQHDRNCSTLILPALSIGNVGQLAVDLLISSTEAKSVGYLDDPYVLPCVGNDPYGPQPTGELVLPLQVYDDSENHLSIVQQRSPVIKGMMLNFCKNISAWAASSGKRDVVILSSIASGKMQVFDNTSQDIYYISSSNKDGMDERCEELRWKKVKDFDPSTRGWQYLESQLVDSEAPKLFLEEDDLQDDDYLPSLPFASLFSLCKARGLNVICLFCLCSEGDNMQEGFILAEAASRLLGKFPNTSFGNTNQKWTMPLSWQSVYGPPPEVSIF